MLFKRPVIPSTYNTIAYIHGAIPLGFPLPLLVPPCLPFVSPSTYLAPSSCDRNRPPPSQVACKLTPFAPPFTQLTHPLQIPRTPTAPRLTMMTSGIFRLLLSRTKINRFKNHKWSYRNYQFICIDSKVKCNILWDCIFKDKTFWLELPSICKVL